jgi:hypothetical protein
MLFNKDTHTKEFLLKNPEVAIQLAMSAKFSEHLLAQDLEVLSIRDNAEPNACTVAHLLAQHHFAWSETPAAHNIDILKLKTKNTLSSVAHTLVTRSVSWRNSITALNYDVMRIADSEGETIAHLLARFNWDFAEKNVAQDKQTLSLTNNDGDSVAHILAESNRAWCESAAAYDKDILTLRNNHGKYVFQCIEKLMGINFVFDPKGLIQRLINIGVGYVHYQPKFIVRDFKKSKNEVEALVNSINDSIDNEVNEIIKLKMLIAAISSIHNVQDYDLIYPEKYDQYKELLSEKIRQITPQIDENYFNSAAHINCEYGVDVVSRFYSEAKISSTIIKINEEDNLEVAKDFTY